LATPQKIAEQCKIQISGNEDAKISIEQVFQTSVVINDESTSMTLTDWKHHYSDWKKLKIQNGRFVTLSPDDKIRKEFPDAELDEFRKYIKKNKGEKWYNVIKDNIKIAENGSFPSYIDISKVLLRIRIQKKNEPLIEKIIIINSLSDYKCEI
jgi:hypothetical protein